MARSSSFAATLANYLGLAGYAASLDSTGKVPAAQLRSASGGLVQMVSVSVKGFTTTNGTKTVDNTPFTNTMGSGFGLTVSMKPTSSSNRVFVKGDLYGSNSSNGNDSWGLFLAGSTSAIIAGAVTSLALGSEIGFMGFHWQVSTVSSATTTYDVRVAGGAGTFTLNGQAGAGLQADSVVSSLTVWEVAN